MIAALLPALSLGRTAGLALAVTGLLATAGLGFWRGMAAIDRMVETARVEAIIGRDAHWKAEISAANARVAEAAAAQARAAMAAETEIRTHSERATTALAELEKRNAELSGGANCGLDRDRVRLLHGQGR